MNTICAVYIITNKNNSVLYTGVTSDLENRMYEYKANTRPRSFAARYHLTKLVYYEEKDSMSDAILREKQIKAGSRKKKIELIKSINPAWKDLTSSISGYDYE
jgi:putative endonuclease